MNLAALIKQELDGVDRNDAIEHNGLWYDWPSLRKTAGEVSTALADAGVPDGARVGLVARNRPAIVASILALMGSRHRIVMLYAFQSATALADDLRQLGLSAVIADEEDWSSEALAAACERGTLAIALSSGPPVSLRTLTQRIQSTPSEELDPQVAVEMLTSGTTGAPKRVPIRWSTLNAAAADLIGMDPDRSAGVVAPPDVLSFPIGNISGLYYLVPAIGTGRRLVLLERFKLDDWLGAIRRHGCTYSAVPPAALRMLMDTTLQKGDLGKLAALGTGAAPLDPKLQADFEERFGIPVLIGYGATEFCGVVATWSLEDHKRYGTVKRGSVGRARPGVQLRIVDRETGALNPPGAPGVIEASVPRIGPGFVRTTDLGHLDSDGFLFLHGRADEMINRGGFKVDPGKITAALCSHPAVADAGVVGVPDAQLGDVPVAAVELRANRAVTEQELLSFLRERLRSFEIPTQIRIVDALPRTPSMKVRLADLRTLLAAN